MGKGVEPKVRKWNLRQKGVEPRVKSGSPEIRGRKA